VRHSGRLIAIATLFAMLAIATSPYAQDEAIEPDAVRPGETTEKDYETLRRLLGLPSPAPKSAASSEPALIPSPAAAPEAEPPVAAPAVVAPEPAPAVRTSPVPVRKQPARPRRVEPKPAAKMAPLPPAVEASPPPAKPAAPVRTEAIVEVPEPGTVIDASNVSKWKHLIGPSIHWAIDRGATLDVVGRRPLPIEPRREQATQRYHAQVRLSDDRRSMKNYVAGIPFPLVTKDDPDLAVKLMFNYESRLVVDDVDLRRSECDTGALTDTGFRIEKHYEPEHFRRLFYVSRLFHEPMPTWGTVEGVRYREVAGPLSEPFDLKGAGYTYARYLDPARQDDSWVYYPSSRRLRRLSTAQSSEGIFGQDIDLDSFAGFAGNPAWTEWKYLGEKTILAPMHARNVPVKFQKAPVDYFPDEGWEAREVHIVVGTSRLVGNSFSRRVLYIDRESLLIPLVELYDMQGHLWKGMLQTWTVRRGPNADGVASDDPPNMACISLFDMQLDHVTRCALPMASSTGERGWYFNEGNEGGTTEEEFTVAGLIARAR
jgi:hypothetical protein